jgi:hypothetical protein
MGRAGALWRSHGHDDLAELAVFLQMAVDVQDIVELEGTIDHRFECAALQAFEDKFHCGFAAGLIAARMLHDRVVRRGDDFAVGRVVR